MDKIKAISLGVCLKRMWEEWKRKPEMEHSHIQEKVTIKVKGRLFDI